MDVNV